jgi:hypothetical protein
MNSRMTVATTREETSSHGPAPSSPSIVIVSWHDAWADAEQHDRSDWRSNYIVRTTGFLVRDDRASYRSPRRSSPRTTASAQ